MNNNRNVILSFLKLFMSSFIRFIILLPVAFYVSWWVNSYLERLNDKPCYSAVLPGLHLCLPRNYYMNHWFPVSAKYGYNWRTTPFGIDESLEGANQLTLLIPTKILPILPIDYEDDYKKGLLYLHLRPMKISQKKYQQKYIKYQSTHILETSEEGTFVFWGQDNYGPQGRKYYRVSTDMDPAIANPRVELSFSIAPADIPYAREHIEKVKAFLNIYKQKHNE